MFDSWETTVPKNTAEANRAILECPISPGILRDVRVYFPLGCVGLAKARVALGEAPILPRSKGNHVSGDGLDVGATDIYEPTEGNLPVLIWEVWNDDAANDHTLQLKAAWVTEEEMATEQALLAGILNGITALLRALGGS